jgi:hypothetical protein
MPRLPQKGGLSQVRKCVHEIRSYDVPGLHMGLSVLSCYGIVELQSAQASASHGKEGDVLYVIYIFRIRDLSRSMSVLYGCARNNTGVLLLTSKTLRMSVLLMTGDSEGQRKGLDRPRLIR